MSIPDSISLAGCTAIVTGGSRGIGKAISFELARRGASIAIVYANPDNTSAANEVVKEIRVVSADINALAILADLRDFGAYERVVQKTLGYFKTGKIDILVHNAGITLTNSTLLTTPVLFDDVLNTNLRAPYFLTQAALPHIPRGGRIILLSSISARSPNPAVTVSSYAASKAAVESLARDWSFEFGQSRGITVNAVAPGLIQTEMISSLPREVIDPVLDQNAGATAAGPRIGTVEEVAHVVAFLASRGASWVSGATISVSGGRSN